MRFHFVMLLIVIFVSLGMHGIASAASVATVASPSHSLTCGALADPHPGS